MNERQEGKLCSVVDRDYLAATRRTAPYDKQTYVMQYLYARGYVLYEYSYTLVRKYGSAEVRTLILSRIAD